MIINNKAFTLIEIILAVTVSAVIMTSVATLLSLSLKGWEIGNANDELSMHAQLLSSLESGEVEALALIDPVALQRIVLSVIAGVAMSGSIGYFAIPLIWFRGKSTGAAILNGLTGMFRNWLPFLVMGALLMVVAIPVVIIIAVLFSRPGGGSGASVILTLIMLLVMVMYQLLLFGAQYLSFKEVFGTGQPDTSSESNQLVA